MQQSSSQLQLDQNRSSSSVMQRWRLSVLITKTWPFINTSVTMAYIHQHATISTLQCKPRPGDCFSSITPVCFDHTTDNKSGPMQLNVNKMIANMEKANWPRSSMENYLVQVYWVARCSRVASVLGSGAEGHEFKSQPRRCQVTALGKLFTSIVPLFTKQQNL